METLYDLLGALPRDDAEGLRAAFRRAVKGTHPDLNPGDPDAGEKFREIVRANEILGDDEQRAAYDHLLDLAHKEQKQQLTAKAVHKVATSVIALVVVAGLGVGGYLVLQNTPELSDTGQHWAEILLARPSDFAALPLPKVEAKAQPAPAAETSVEATPPETTKAPPALVETRIETASAEPAPGNREAAAVPSKAIAPVATTAQAVPDNTAPAAVGRPLEIAPSDARAYRERGIFAYRSGDFDGAIAEFDRAIQLDPKFSAAYVDRSIVLYRMQKFERAFADIAHAKRIEKQNRAKAAPATAKKPKPTSATASPGLPSFFQRRTARLEERAAISP